MAIAVTLISTKAALDDLPVAYWPLRESSGATGIDLSGNSYTLTYTGSPTLGVAGPVAGGGTGITFADNTSYAKRTLAVIGGTNLNQDFSIEAWVHTPDGNGGELVSQSLGAATHSAIHLYVFPAVYVCEVINNAGAAAISVATTGTDYTDDAWHHVVATWDTSENTLLIYVDGVLKGTTVAAPTGTVDAMDTTTLGTRWRGGVAYGAGAVDSTLADVALYQTALSATRVAAHYAARGGQALEPLRGTLSVEQTYGARHVCACAYADHSGAGVHPSLGDTVTVVDGATTVFAGLLASVTEEALASSSWASVRRSVTATDYGALCDQRLVTKTWASGDTLEGVLEDLITDYLDDFSITLDPAQATGATLPEIAYTNQTVTAVLNDLAARTGWTWLISYSKVLGMYAAGTTTAPFSVTSASTDVQALSWEATREGYYNRLYVTYGPSGAGDVVDTWTATAGQTVFPLHYSITGYRAVTEGVTYYPVGLYGTDTMLWTYQASTNSLIRSSGATVGTAISVNVSVMWPQTTSTQVAAWTTNPWEAAITSADCTDYTSAQALATTLLAQFAVDAKRVTFQTTTSGLAVGQLLTITLADRHLSGTHLITSVQVAHDAESSSLLRYTVECVSGDYAQGTFLDTYRQWGGVAATGQASGSAVVAGGVGGASDGSTGVYAGAATYASAPWRVSPEGKMVAGSWTFASAPSAALASSGATDIMRALDGTTEKVLHDWDSTALYRITVAGGSVYTFGPGLRVGAPAGGDKGAGTINAAGGVYDNNVKLVNAAGYSGTIRVAQDGGGYFDIVISNGLITAVT